MEIPIEMDDLGVPLFSETPTSLLQKEMQMCKEQKKAKLSSAHQASELLGADLRVTAEVRETWEDGRICYPLGKLGGGFKYF